MTHYDFIIVGGGSAVSAATSAARCSAVSVCIKLNQTNSESVNQCVGC